MFGAITQAAPKSTRKSLKTVEDNPNLARHFDGRGDYFNANIGIAPGAEFSPGQEWTSGRAFTQVLSNSGGEITRAVSEGGKNRSGIRYVWYGLAGITDTPVVSMELRGGADPDASDWTVGFVYSCPDPVNNLRPVEFVSSGVNIAWNLYTNGVLLPTMSTPGGGASFGGGVSPADFSATGPKLMLLSADSTPQFAVRCISLDTGARVAYDNGEFHSPGTLVATDYQVSGVGRFEVGNPSDGYNLQSTMDFILHEAFFLNTALSSSEVDDLERAARNKWVERS